MLGWFIALCGVFSICGAAFDADWFMNHRKARLFVSLFGRVGARIFYGLLGSGLVVLGTSLALGFVKDRH